MGKVDVRMVEEVIRRGFGPLLALLNSADVDRIAARNNLSFAELFLPFSNVECEVKVWLSYVFLLILLDSVTFFDELTLKLFLLMVEVKIFFS